MRFIRVSVFAVAAAVSALPSPASAIGLLVPTDAGAPLRLVSHRVNVEVTERGATTRVTQEFENPTGRQLEATYLFPLPKGATVDEFALWMNGRREIGKVMERAQARAIYESIVRRARDPGLIEYVNSELFEARVFPIPPNGRQKVELIYSHLVDYDGGTHRYLYPMKTDQRAASTLQDFMIAVKISNKLPIRNVYSPTHRLAIQKKGNTAMASFEKNAFSLADDLSLYWSVDDKDVGVTLLSYREGDEPGYFLMLASPKDGFREKEIIGKRVSFVADISGSMTGEKMEATRKALDYCLSKLGDDDLFNVIAFGGFVETFSGPMVAASKENIQKAREFVRKLEPAGGTNIDEALQAAFKGATGSNRAPHIIVFMTDGLPTAGETDIAKIIARVEKSNDHHARIFAFGVGTDVNTILLDKISTTNRGSATYLKPDMSLQEEVSHFYDRMSHPVLSDLELSIDGVRTYGALPDRLPDLFKGGQLVVLGRYRESGKSKVKLAGTTPSGRQTFEYEANFASGNTEHSFIPRLWAQRQVGALLAQVREKGENSGLVSEITQLATKYGIVTPYTSYLVVEKQDAPLVRPDVAPREQREASANRARGGNFDDLGAFAPSGATMPAEPAPPTAAPEADFGSGEGVMGARSLRGKKAASAPEKAREMLRKDSGDEAVAAAKEIGRLSNSTIASDRKVQTSVAHGSGHTFRFQDGFYVDVLFDAKHATLELEAFSKAYFLVLELRPDLKSALMLGDSVKVTVAKGRTLVIVPKGKQEIDRGTLEKFLKKD